MQLPPRLYQTIEWRWVIYTIYLQQRSNYASTNKLYNRYFPHDARSRVQEVTSSRQLTGMQSKFELIKTYIMKAGFNNNYSKLEKYSIN